MKIAITIILIISSLLGFSQSEIKSVNLQSKTFKIKSPQKIAANKKLCTKVEYKSKSVVPVKTEAYYTNYINTIREKIKFVKENPEEDERAKAIGWYTEMEKNIEEAIIEREKLISTY